MCVCAQFYNPWKYQWFLKWCRNGTLAGSWLISSNKWINVCDFYYVLNQSEIESVMSLWIQNHIFEFSCCANVYVFSELWVSG